MYLLLTCTCVPTNHDTCSTMRLPPRFSRHITRRADNVPHNVHHTTQGFKCSGNAKDGNGGGGNIAVLIDADNVHPRYLSNMMTEVANYGTPSVRRIYGDWTAPQNRIWQESLLQHSVVPIQQFAYSPGKNSTGVFDSAIFNFRYIC